MSGHTISRSRTEASRTVINILNEKWEVKSLYGGFYIYIDCGEGIPPLPIIGQVTDEDVILSAMLIYSGNDSSWDEGSRRGFDSIINTLNLQLHKDNAFYRFSLIKTLRHEIFGDCVSASQVVEYNCFSDCELSRQVNDAVWYLKKLYSTFIEYMDNRGKKSNSTEGCYIATCVYGSYDCPQVWTLRRYRDNILSSTWYGRAFIKTYYAISPTLVKWFGHTEWFKNIWQGCLDRMVEELQENGIESTPYEDKQW